MKIFLFFCTVVSTVTYVFSIDATCKKAPSDSRGLVQKMRSEIETILQKLTEIQSELTDVEYGLTDCGISSRLYTGKQNCTKSGRICMEWKKQDPHTHVYKDRDFSDGTMEKAGNYCRDPNGGNGKPWCYTIDADVVAEDCNVPRCNTFF
ncbi:hypothetical protein CHS0354_021129 [Potamilus streckersoni]|uniref:Kringle domain-containing protein n=1 Tax=Potamilus streckersoni TaxID=2493646 RepID=A0AAE0T5V1_9BIVA|nr:hypothetical protein CHS0354_021129 [Potamilus streckersoni]